MDRIILFEKLSNEREETRVTQSFNNVNEYSKSNFKGFCIRNININAFDAYLIIIIENFVCGTNLLKG